MLNADPEKLTASSPTILTALPRRKPKAKRKPSFNPNLCWCGCGSRKNPKRRYVSGHSAYARYRLFGCK